jgi:hypothetical protein
MNETFVFNKMLPEVRPKPALEGHFRFDPPGPEALPIGRLRPRNCRWPLFDLFADDALFCGKPVKPGLPYCPKHCKRAFMPNKGKLL